MFVLLPNDFDGECVDCADTVGDGIPAELLCEALLLMGAVCVEERLVVRVCGKDAEFEGEIEADPVGSVVAVWSGTHFIGLSDSIAQLVYPAAMASDVHAHLQPVVGVPDTEFERIGLQ